METFFGFVMYCIFGKRWLLWQMKQGYRGAVFVNETEIEMTKSRMDEISRNIESMKAELKSHQEIPPHIKYDYLGDGIPSAKQEYEAERKAEEQNKVVISSLENRIKSRTSDLMAQDADLQKSFAIAYSNRMKWDFLNNYKIKKTYSDKGYADQFKK